MRTGRNCGDYLLFRHFSLDHWDMRTGRNWDKVVGDKHCSLDHWDMRTGRNKWVEFDVSSSV